MGVKHLLSYDTLVIGCNIDIHIMIVFPLPPNYGDHYSACMKFNGACCNAMHTTVAMYTSFASELPLLVHTAIARFMKQEPLENSIRIIMHALRCNYSVISGLEEDGIYS